jgi:hypothetical protein
VSYSHMLLCHFLCPCRGNLGLDCLPEKMALVQKNLIQSCNLVRLCSRSFSWKSAAVSAAVAELGCGCFRHLVVTIIQPCNLCGPDWPVTCCVADGGEGSEGGVCIGRLELHWRNPAHARLSQQLWVVGRVLVSSMFIPICCAVLCCGTGWQACADHPCG